MTQDEIIEITKRSGLGMLLEIGGMDKCLEHFAKLVAAKEREACADVCGRFADEALACGDEDAVMCFEQAEDAIRARGNA